jgi:hypothetical protein
VLAGAGTAKNVSEAIEVGPNSANTIGDVASEVDVTQEQLARPQNEERPQAGSQTTMWTPTQWLKELHRIVSHAADCQIQIVEPVPDLVVDNKPVPFPATYERIGAQLCLPVHKKRQNKTPLTDTYNWIYHLRYAIYRFSLCSSFSTFPGLQDA